MWARALSVVLMWVVSCLAAGPPYLSERYEPRKIERVGRTIRLKCPVDGDPEPFMMRWSKDGQDINENAWERFRISEDILRIKDAIEQDSGVYLCKGINGFGHVIVNYTLIVLSENATIPHHLSGGGSSGDTSGIPPRFSDPTKMRKRIVQRPVGSSIRLRCKASGRPRPNIVWFKDGEPIAGVEQDANKRPTWILKLRSLQVANSGKYTCRVFNRAGAINFTYSLDVIGKTDLQPVFLPPHPVNTTVMYGKKATFLCKVKSDVEPHIQWLKLIDDPEELKKSNATIDVNNQKFVVLSLSKVWGSPETSFINKLSIDHVTEKHSGMYVCLVTSQRGYNFRSAFLTVTPVGIPKKNMSEKKQEEPQSYLAIYIIAPCCVLVVVGIVALYCCRKKKCRDPKTVQQQKYIQRYQDKDLATPLQQPQYSQNSKERIYRNMTLDRQPEYSNCESRAYRPDLRQHAYAEPVIHSDAHSDVSTRVHSDLPSELSSVHTRDRLSDMYSDVSSIPTMHSNGLQMADMYCDGPGLPRVHHNPMDLHATLLARLQQQNRFSNQRTPTPSESSSVSRVPHMHYGMS